MHHHYVNQDTPPLKHPYQTQPPLWAGLSPEDQGGVL